MSADVVFVPSDRLVREFRRIYHGGVFDHLQHFLLKSFLFGKKANERLVDCLHQALLARFWPWSGDIAHPVMGYPDGEDVRVLWCPDEEDKLLITLNWVLSGLMHDNTAGSNVIARGLASEFVEQFARGGLLRSDGAEFSFSQGQLLAKVTHRHHMEFEPTEEGWVKEG